MKSDSVLLVAATDVDNYGTLLQAYALQKTLCTIFQKDIKIVNCKYRCFIKQTFRVFNYELVKVKIKGIILTKRVKQNKSHYDYYVAKKNKFDEFRTNDLIFTEAFYSEKKLLNSMEDTESVILGSDQVWNPVNLGRDYYTLSWASDRINKIAYGPSFGVNKIPLYQKRKTEQYLKRFQHISVREKTGAAIVEELIGRRPTVVCDPTLLVDTNMWNEFERGVSGIPEHYIFCYFLGDNKASREFACRLKKQTGYEIIQLPFMDEFVKYDSTWDSRIINSVGPREFVYLIHNASIICTDSFHGTVFSILFHKEFYCSSRKMKSGKISTSNRIVDLLDTVGMRERFGLSERKIIPSQLYSEIDNKLVNLREQGMKYLRESIGD